MISKNFQILFDNNTSPLLAPASYRRILIKELNSKFKEKAGYLGALYCNNDELAEDSFIDDYGADIDKLFYKKILSKVEIELQVIPNGHWLGLPELNIRRLKFSDQTSFEELSKQLMIIYSMNNKGYWIQMFNERMPLFRTKSAINLRDLNFANGSNLYIDFLPDSLEADCYGEEFQPFIDNDYWQTPTKQTEFSKSCFLSTLKALSLFLNTETTSQYLPYFLNTLKDFAPFSPVIGSLIHLFCSKVMNVDCLVIARCFFYWMKHINKDRVQDSELFVMTPQWIFNILIKINWANETKQNNFLDISVKDVNTKQMRNEPYYVIEDSIIIDIKEKSEIANYNNISTIAASDFKLLITLLQEKTINISTDISDTCSYIAFTGKVNTNNLTKENCEMFEDINKLSQEICQHQYYRFLAFTPQNIALKENVGNCIAAFTGPIAIVLTSREKSTKKSNKIYKCFHPMKLTVQSVDSKFNLLAKEELVSLNVPVVVDGIDTRPLEQIDVILLDYSGSMNEVISNINKFDAAVIVLKTFVDKLFCYDLSHAVGFISFNHQITINSKITRNYEKFAETIQNINPNGTTHLWCAIHKAIEMIEKFQNKEKMRSTFNTIQYKQCIKRILCLTDGGDNSDTNETKIDINIIAELLKNNNIKLDTVSISEHKDNFLYSLQALAYYTEAYCFWSGDEFSKLCDTMASEAFLSVRQRAVIQSSNSTFADLQQLALQEKLSWHKCNIKIAASLNHKAVRKEPQTLKTTIQKDNSLKMSRPKRILKEYVLVNANTDFHAIYTFYIGEMEFDHWKVIYSGVTGSYYNHYHWLITVQFPEEYPSLPPIIRFCNATKIYHPNVSKDGRICHEIISSKWTPVVKCTEIFENIHEMLLTPNPEDALEQESANLYRELQKRKQDESYDVTKDPYVITVNKWNEEYARKSCEALKTEFLLNEY